MQTFDSQTPNIKCVDLKYFESITFRCKPAHFIDSGSFKLSILTPHTLEMLLNLKYYCVSQETCNLLISMARKYLDPSSIFQIEVQSFNFTRTKFRDNKRNGSYSKCHFPFPSLKVI